METKQYEKEQFEEVVQAIEEGKTIAFPTDTVYGLGVRYDSEEALTRLKQAKIRPDSKPIPMMVSQLSQIETVAYVSEVAKVLIQHFMPGAFTIILKKKESVPAYVSNGLKSIAIRMPDDAFVLGLMDAIQKPMLVTSANISAQHSCQTYAEVLAQLDGRIDGIVVGKSQLANASTIVDATQEKIVIVREGPISKQMIESVLEEQK